MYLTVILLQKYQPCNSENSNDFHDLCNANQLYCCAFQYYATVTVSQTVRRSPVLFDNLHHSLHTEHFLSGLAPLLSHPLLLMVNLLPVLE